MMATHCPNPACGYKLKWKDWRQNCPVCGTNVVYYNMEKRLEEEADRVETENAAVQKRMDRMKANLVGSPWAIARLVLLFLPLGALFLPLGRVELHAPFVSEAPVTLQAISIFSALAKLDVGALFALLGDRVFVGAFLWLTVALVLFVLTALACLAGLISAVFAGGPKALLRAVVISVTGAAAILGSGFSFLAFGNRLVKVVSNQLEFQLQWGCFVVAILFLAILAVNIYIKASGGIPVQYKPCFISGFPEEEVQTALAQGLTLDDMRRKLKAGGDEAGGVNGHVAQTN
ncbi:MAG: hypothetical protein LBB50_00975 [Oscillospiraceae bacterium]|nr:hypothetical protein [Oscillospiraceae bacterium]